MTGFELHRPPLLSRLPEDRGDPGGSESARALDSDALDAGWRGGYVLSVSRRGKVRLDADRETVYLAEAPTVSADRPAEAVLVGNVGGRQVWALADPALDAEVDAGAVPGELDAPAALGDLRTHGGVFGARENSWLVTALALLNWHRGAGFCARDGGRTAPASAGWVRVCEVCGREEYPRTDPAIICLVHDGGDKVLLARQPSWPRRRFSVLAGFVEAGESLETCVAREIGEEVGLSVTGVRYLGSQPWPFPRSIMLGFTAVADPDAPLRYVDGEIGEARWFTRGEVRAALEVGDWAAAAGPSEAPLLLPGSISIARGMVESWAYPGARPAVD